MPSPARVSRLRVSCLVRISDFVLRVSSRSPQTRNHQSVTLTASLPRRQRADDPLALFARRRFQLRQVAELLDDASDDLLALFLVGNLAPAEDDRDDDLVLVRQEFASAVDLDLDVVVAGLGANAN